MSRARALFSLYYLVALTIGGVLGYQNWGGPIGIAGGLFLGLLIGTALFYCFAILLTLPMKKDASDGDADTDA